MEQTTKKGRPLLTKKPFYRVSPETNERGASPLLDIGEQPVLRDRVLYMEVTQADFKRELDPNAHAINDRNIYKNYRQSDADGLYYEEDFPRYAFAYQQEILDDRLARLTGNDIQFDLADKSADDKKVDAYSSFKGGWADKRMENAWHFSAKSIASTGDGAFVGYLLNGVFKWKVLSYNDGDVLYPHYDKRTGELTVLGRTYTNYDDDGIMRNYVDVWDDKYYYRFVDGLPIEQNENNTIEENTYNIGGYTLDGYYLEERSQHYAPFIPVSYMRRDDGPVWSPSQETIEHKEAAFSRLAQNNHDFGLPILGLYGQGKDIKELAMSDMSYASKIFILPQDGKAEFLNRQDASNAYKTELDMLEAKIYSQSMVIKAPELKSGDTPAAAIKLLYSDAYNKAMLEAQEYDPFIRKMIEIFKWGYGVESERRLDFINTRISYYIVPFLPVNDQEVTSNLAMAVQNGFVSKQTASEKFYFSTPQEWERIKKEKHDDQAQELLLEEQRMDMQQENTIETQEQLADIQTTQQIEVIEAQAEVAKESEGEDTAKAVKTKKGSVATGRGAGRPRTVGTDKWGNRANENNWETWNASH